MQVIDFVGVFAFALSGGLTGVRRRFDIFGVLVIAYVTALGGGIIRDLLLGITPPRNLSHLPFIAVALVGGLVCFLFEGTVGKARRLVLVADAVGLGSFAVAGTRTAFDTGHPGIEAVFIGLITAVGGGVLRDVLASQVPSIFSPELYAVPALLGCLATDLAARTSTLTVATQWAIVALVFVTRLAALKYHWESPIPGRLTRERRPPSATSGS